MYRGATIVHWSKSQSNVALSSAEAELNACVKGLSEMLSLYNLISEVFCVVPSLRLCTDASACRGMLLRHGAGKVKHLSVKQLWSQEVVQCFNVQIDRVPRSENPADLLTHSVSFPVAGSQLERLHAYRDGVGGRESARAISYVGIRPDEDRGAAVRAHSSGHTLESSAAVASTSLAHCESAGSNFITQRSVDRNHAPPLVAACLIKATPSDRDEAVGSLSRGGVQVCGLDQCKLRGTNQHGVRGHVGSS